MSKNIETKVIHSSYVPEEHNRAIMPPIYQNSMFKLQEINEDVPFYYSRAANPTRLILEKTVADLENGAGAVALASGMAAIDAIWRLVLRPGDTIIVVENIYGGAYDLLTRVYKNWGITFIFADLTCPEALEPILEQHQIKLIWLESPSNPLLKLVDIERITILAKRKNKNIIIGIDNTFATPYLQKPFLFGVDFIVHSATKYLSGHSDVLLGVAIAKDLKYANALKDISIYTGNIAGPMDCSLVLRGIKTLIVRMQQHEKNARTIAQRLTQHSEVQEVYYPGLPQHPQHELAKKQMNGFGGIVTIRLKDDTRDKVNRVIKALQLFQLSYSLGGVESLVNHSYTQSHAGMEREKKQALGISQGLLRFSIGIEAVDDIWQDLQQALSA